MYNQKLRSNCNATLCLTQSLHSAPFILPITEDRTAEAVATSVEKIVDNVWLYECWCYSANATAAGLTLAILSLTEFVILDNIRRLSEFRTIAKFVPLYKAFHMTDMATAQTSFVQPVNYLEADAALQTLREV